MTAKEINKKIQEMISSDSVPQDEIIRFVKGECQTVSLTPQTLGMFFERDSYIRTKKLASGIRKQ